jgi:hypothetical protein
VSPPLTAAVALAPGSFVLDGLAVVAAVGALAWCRTWLLWRLSPRWGGPPARLVDSLLVLLALTASAETLGALDELRRGPLFGTCVLVGGALAIAGHPARRSAAGDAAPKSTSAEVAAAAVAAALVTAQWVSHTAYALHRGMTHPDTLAYHGPFAARFLQHGTFGSLAGVGNPPRRVYPLSSELLHAAAAVPFHRDVLSPMLNLGWAALLLLAAWCVGRRRGAGPLCVLAAAVVLGLPSLAGTQPGQASNDVVSAALLVTAVALLLEAELTPTVCALSGAAAGLGLSAKLTIVAPVIVLTAGVIVFVLRDRRAAAAATWVGGLVGASIYWFIRDWIVAGSPAPFLNITIGPLSLRGAYPETGVSAAHYFGDGTVWRRYYLPGLKHALGPGWPVILVLGVGAAVLLAVRSRRRLERLAAAAVLVGTLAYPFLPLTGDGGGRSFQYNLRYYTPVLALAFVLVALVLASARPPWRTLGAVALLGLVVLDASRPSLPADRMPGWPADGVAAGVVAGAAVLAAVLLVVYRPAARRPSPPTVAWLAAATIAGLLVGGWFVQRQYLRGRYVHAGLSQAAIQTPFHTIRDASVAAFGDPEVYPMFGPDLTNRVTTPDGPTLGPDVQLCQRWKQILSGRYRYVVLGHVFIFVFTPAQSWFLTDPSAASVVRGPKYAVFRLHGPLDPARCPR